MKFVDDNMLHAQMFGQVGRPASDWILALTYVAFRHFVGTSAHWKMHPDTASLTLSHFRV